MISTTARRTAAAALLGAMVAVSALCLGSSAALADDEDGIGLSVTVPGSSTVPGAVVPGTVTPVTGSTRGPSSTGTTPSDDTVDPVADTTPALEDDEVDLGGVLYISGLSSAYEWSVNPLDGRSETSFTVRNVSDTTFSSTARFWLDSPFGTTVSEVKGVKITDLKPGESRVVDATLGGIGQWTFVTAHATLTPPKSVEGVELDSITRDQFVVIPPWGVLSLVGLGGIGFAGYALVQFVRRPYAPAGLAGAPA
jgi:hypothetical protein